MYRYNTSSGPELLDIGVQRVRMAPGGLQSHLGGTMSRKLSVILLAMLVLVGAMGLKTAVVAHGNGAVIMANGGAPQPPVPPDAFNAEVR